MAVALIRTVFAITFALYVVYHFLQMAISRPLFEVKTNYLHWSSVLPAVTVCQVPSTRNKKSTLEEFLSNLVRPDERYCRKCSNETNFPTDGYRRIVSERVKGCSDLFEDCRWNGLKLDCCSSFKRLPTNRGICHSMNSGMTGYDEEGCQRASRNIQNKDKNKEEKEVCDRMCGVHHHGRHILAQDCRALRIGLSRFKLEVSHYAKQGELSFSTNEDVKVYLHDPKELRFSRYPSIEVVGGEKLDSIYRVLETVTDDSARFLSLESRGCVLPGELPGYLVYSQSSCQLQCLAVAQARRCSCIHHLLPKIVSAPDCNLEGLMCLDKHFNVKKEKKILNKCKCLPSCEEMDINIVWSNKSRTHVNSRDIKLLLSTPPTEKIILRARYTPIDVLGKYTKNIQNGEIVYPVRVTKDGNYVEKFDQRFKRSNVYQEPTIHYKINLRKKATYIDLEPNAQMFSPGCVLELHTNDSTSPDQLSNIKTKLLSDQQCIYTGKVRGYEDSSAAVSTCDGLSGFIRVKRKTLFIEPVRDNMPNLYEKPHVIYKYVHTKRGSPNCAVNESISNKQKAIKDPNFRRRSAKINNANEGTQRIDYNRTLPLHLESLVVIDSAMIKKHLPNSELENYVMTILNMAQSLFNDLNVKPSINFELVRMVELLDDAEKMNQWKGKSADERLNLFSEWQNFINPRSEDHPNHHDIAILLTGNDICDKNGGCHYVGIAEKSGICRPRRQATMCKDNGLLLGYTLAHEIAHNLGIEHDTGFGKSCNPVMPDGSSSIMNPTISFHSRTWSKCSQDSLTDLIESGYFSCLEDVPTAKYINHMDMLPGVIYGGDFQCKRLYSPDASECSNEGDCQSLKCQLKGTPCSNTGMAPVPGTSCGENKWCYEGACVEAGKRPESVQGGWSAWSEWSACTRSCGSGITTSTRDCNNPTPRHGGKMCSGRMKRHKVCSTEPCPDGSISFRDVQCAQYNNWIFPEDRKLHTWKGFFISNANPCALTCKNENNVVVSLTPKVIDGTSCYRGLRDVCIDGECMNIPCDLQFDNNSVEDSCGVCHGNGTECKVIQGTKTFEGSMNVIPFLPAGTRNIKMKMLNPAKSHILVKGVNNKEVFNHGETLGIFKVPGSVAWLGMVKPNQEILEIPGTIEQPISIWVTSEGSQTVAYTLGLPSEPRKGKYSWDYTGWLPCKAQCGEGYQEAEPKCVELMSGHVEDKYCKGIEKPRIKRRSCIAGLCYARWLVGEWQECGPCPGSEAKRFRIVHCIKPIAGLEEGTAFVPSEECPGERPASSEHCPCLKRQASYWPPHYKSHSSFNNFQKVLRNSYKIRRVRSTKIPEKKVTLMQLENESEESMLKQFKENQHKRYPFLFMPGLFGTRFNFTIPLKKRQALFTGGNFSTDLMNKIIQYDSYENSLNELEKYPEQLLSDSSHPQLSAYLPYNYLPTIELNSVNNQSLDNFSKDIWPMNTDLHTTTPIPLHFSDKKILKILSDNLALHKLKDQQDLKIRNKPCFRMLSPKKSALENNRKKLDFLNLISNQLYRTLEMQAYLQSLLNSSQEKINREPFKIIPNELTAEPVRYKYKVVPRERYPLFEKNTNILDFDLSNNSFGRKPLQYEHLKWANISHLKSKDEMENNNHCLFDVHPISNRKLKPFSEFKVNIIKPNTNYSENINSGSIQSNENKTGNSNILKLQNRNLFFELTTALPKLKEDTKLKQNIYQEKMMPITGHAFDFQAYDGNENEMVDKIINKLRDLPHESKERLYHDLVSITEYLKYLLSFDMVSNLSSLDQPDNDNIGSFFKNEGINFVKNYVPKLQNSHRKNPALSNSFFEDCFKDDFWMSHKNLPKAESLNKLLDKLYNFYDQMYNKEKYNDLDSFSSLMHSEHDNYKDTDFLSKSRLNGSLPFQSSNTTNKMKQQENVLSGVKNEQLAEIFGPLKFFYSIPEGRLCNITTTPKCETFSLCRIKRSATKKPSWSIVNMSKNTQRNATLGNDFIPIKIVPQQKCFNTKHYLFSSLSQNQMDKKRPKIVQASTNNIYLYVNGSEFVSPKCNEEIPYSDNKQNDLFNAGITVSTTTRREVNIRNDSFYNPPVFDTSFDMKHVICRDNLIYELQKELQLSRHRNCTQCYYLYKDETTLDTRCPRI